MFIINICYIYMEKYNLYEYLFEFYSYISKGKNIENKKGNYNGFWRF